MRSSRRAALEAIAYGDDPKVTPSDRLKALELLGDQDVGDPFALRGLSGEALDAAWDELIAPSITALRRHRGMRADLVVKVEEARKAFPLSARALDFAVEAELETRREALAMEQERARIEAEVERRAEARALELYVARGVQAAEGFPAPLSASSSPEGDVDPSGGDDPGLEPPVFRDER